MLFGSETGLATHFVSFLHQAFAAKCRLFRLIAFRILSLQEVKSILTKVRHQAFRFLLVALCIFPKHLYSPAVLLQAHFLPFHMLKSPNSHPSLLGPSPKVSHSFHSTSCLFPRQLSIPRPSNPLSRLITEWTSPFRQGDIAQL